MTETYAKVRQNYWAILLAAVACFVFEAIWYSIFLQTWLDGIGRTRQWLMSSGMNEYVQYGTALASAAVIAAAISCITQLTGAQTAIRGIKTGAAVWVSFVLTTWGTEYIFEVKPVSLLGVNAGFWLVGMMLMGAIVGGWKRQGTGSRE
jgi:hypothetical protein